MSEMSEIDQVHLRAVMLFMSEIVIIFNIKTHVSGVTATLIFFTLRTRPLMSAPMHMMGLRWVGTRAGDLLRDSVLLLSVW